MAVRDNEMVNLNTDEEVKKVLDLLGQSGDSGDATAMAKLNRIQITASENASDLTNVEKVLGRIETALTNTGAVKHIQRGRYSFSYDGSAEVTLSGFSRLDKMIAIIDGGGNYNRQGDVSYAILPSVSELTVNKLKITYSSSDDPSRSPNGFYQVVEFY